MDFTAIDFETANRRSDSACQFGAAVVRGGEVVRRHQWLIRPRPFSFDPGHIRIHGIRPEQVADELEFDELWDEIWSVLAGHCLVAHNAVFDIRVLQGCLATHEIPVPKFNFTCTRLIARRSWPEWQGFGLAAIADRLGITFRHHDALEDAVACAQVMLAAAAKAKVTSVLDLEQQLSLQRGQCGPGGYRDARSPGVSSRRDYSSRSRWHRASSARSGRSADRARPFPFRPSLSSPNVAEPAGATAEVIDLEILRTEAENLRSWTGKHVVFTGVLRQMQRYQAECLAECLGATCQRTVSGKTDLVVVGEPDQRTIAADRSRSVKEDEARKRAEDGQAIEFLTEEAFLQILRSASPDAVSH